MSLHSHVKPNTWLFLRLPSNSLKCIEIKPNTIIDVGKLGSFPSNLLLGRPYYFTYEIVEKRADEAYSRLRVVPPSELNAEVVAEEATPSESRGEPATPSPDGANGASEAYDTLAEDGAMKTNRLTIDDASRQALTQQEIEELKKTTAGQDVIDKILANHANLDEKTVFAKAKYMLRKRNKYLKRFTILPMDLGGLMGYVFEKEPQRILEMREETLGLVTAWSNAHVTEDDEVGLGEGGKMVGGGRWLVVDETGGLVVAALAERMGLLHNPEDSEEEAQTGDQLRANGDATHTTNPETTSGPATIPPPPTTNGHAPPPDDHPHLDFPPPAPTNTLTLLHPAVQPNISLLKYFGYDANNPDPSHPLHTHLKPLSWLQLLHPAEDPTYREPPHIPEPDLQRWKSGKRGAYFKKRRRWERCKLIVDETRQGGFDGLVIASGMDPATILPHTVPLVRGGGHVVIYSPTAEPLVNIMDLYSKERRTAYISQLARGLSPSTDAEDFPLDPRLLLAPTLQTSRVREWQVLPGRTHPVMTGRGGAEGYVFTARKVVPLEGGVEARGNFGKKRKVDVVAVADGSAEAGASVGS